MKPLKKQIRKPRRSLSSLGTRTNVDAKLTQAALFLEYSFGFAVDFKNRIISITGDIDKETFEVFEAAMTEMESQSRSTITIKINSPGGEVYQALAIVGRLKESKCNVVTRGYGHIMSAATLILAAGNKRYVSKFAFFMHHESSYEVEGKHSDVKNEVRQMELEEQHWAGWMSEFTSKTKEFWSKTGVGSNAYFSAAQLVKLGVADELF